MTLKTAVKNLSAGSTSSPRGSSRQAETKPVKKAAVKPVVVKADRARYFEARGGRKTSNARVRLYTTHHTGITINGKDLKAYFPEADLQATVKRPLVVMGMEEKLGVTVMANGGGLRGQADAIALGIARALTLFDGEFRKQLRKENLLTRDSRAVERKKYGLRKARRAPQWAKR